MTAEQTTALIAQAELNEARRTAHVRSRIYGYDFDTDGGITYLKGFDQLEYVRVVKAIGINDTFHLSFLETECYRLSLASRMGKT